MLQLRELDERVSIRDQIQDQSKEPVVLVNVSHVAPEQADALLAAWTDDANYFRSQPGFISTQLHPGSAGTATYLNDALWQGLGSFRPASTHPVPHSPLQHAPHR